MSVLPLPIVHIPLLLHSLRQMLQVSDGSAGKDQAQRRIRRREGSGAAMGIWLMAAICFIFIPPSGAWKVNTEIDPIEALLGEDVTLPCLLYGISTPMNLKIVGVYWTRKSQDGTINKVYQFEGYDHTQFRPGSNMADNDLLLGDASLHLSHVRISDEGKYRCRVIVSPDDGEATYTLLVSGKPQVTLINSVSVSLRDQKSVTCNLTQFYPKDVKIQWIKRSKRTGTNSSLDGDTYFTVPTENSDGTFNMSSTLTVRPSSTEEMGDEYFCIVRHRSLKTNIESSFTLTVTEMDMSSIDLRIALITLVAINIITIAVVLWLQKGGSKRLSPFILIGFMLISVAVFVVVMWLQFRDTSNHYSIELTGMLILLLIIMVVMQIPIAKEMWIHSKRRCLWDRSSEDSHAYSQVVMSEASKYYLRGNETSQSYEPSPTDSGISSTEHTVVNNGDEEKNILNRKSLDPHMYTDTEMSEASEYHHRTDTTIQSCNGSPGDTRRPSATNDHEGCFWDRSSEDFYSYSEVPMSEESKSYLRGNETSRSYKPSPTDSGISSTDFTVINNGEEEKNLLNRKSLDPHMYTDTEMSEASQYHHRKDKTIQSCKGSPGDTRRSSATNEREDMVMKEDGDPRNKK